MMSWHSGFGDLVLDARDAAHAGDLERALRLVVDKVTNIGLHDPARARIFTSAELDALVLELGALGDHVRVAPSERVVIMATALYRVGGHTRVVRDLIAAEPADNITILVSNVGHDLGFRELAEMAPAKVDIRLAPKGGLALTTRWLQRQLTKLAPARTYLFNHPFDAPIIAACQPELTGKLYFYHHNDHSLTLGAHIPHATHIDFNAKGHFNCKENEHVQDLVVWPLSSDQLHPIWRLRHNWCENGLTTACVGTINKFEPVNVLQPLSYVVSYDQAVATILMATGGRHLHVGELSREMLDRIERRLNQAGVSPERFIHRPYVPTLAGAFEDYHVDLYLGSFPRGGGRALVEAMAAGAPLLLHSNYRSIFFCDVHEAYPGVRQWRTLKDLAEALQATTADVLVDESGRSRAFFEARHAPLAFAATVSQTLAGLPAPIPAKPDHSIDPLQTYLDERNAYEGWASAAAPTALARDALSELEKVDRAQGKPEVLTALASTLDVSAGCEVTHYLDVVERGPNYMDIRGWVFGNPKISHLTVTHNDRGATITRPVLDRQDVVDAFPDLATLTCGYQASWRWVDEQPSPDRIKISFFSGSSIVGTFVGVFRPPRLNALGPENAFEKTLT